jgi:AcrR family transcriptional regulator
MATQATRDALLEQGALLFAHHGVHGVSARELHEAAGARNASALHYHFGGRAGLAAEIVAMHIAEVEARRAVLVERLVEERRTGDLRALVHALAAPMADDLASPVGRAHLRLVAQLNHPSLAYKRGGFETAHATAGAHVARWLHAAIAELPSRVRRERFAALHGSLVSLFALRAQLLDDAPELASRGSDTVFFENLLDMLVGALTAPVAPSLLRR